MSRMSGPGPGPGPETNGSDFKHSEPAVELRSPRDPKLSPGEYCEVCGDGSRAECMLLCDGCDLGYHTYCLDPPLNGSPKGDWFCMTCLKNLNENYGFEEGREYTLGSFQKMADEFLKNYVGQHFPGRPSLTEDDLEKEFWRLVESPYDSVQVEYGADLHSSLYTR